MRKILILFLFFIFQSSFSQNLEQEKAKIENLINQASLFYKKGEYSNSLNTSRQALVLSFKINDDRLIAYAYNSIGVLYNEFSNSKQAIEFYHKALIHTKEFEDEALKNWLYGNLGSAYYFSEHNPKKGIAYYKKSLLFAEKINDKPQICYTKLNIASAYFALDNYKQGYKFLKEVEQEVLKNGEDDAKVLVYNLLGIYETAEKKYDIAEKNHLKAIDLAKQNNMNFDLVNIYENILFLYRESNDLAKQKYYLLQKNNLAKIIKAEEDKAKLENSALQIELDVNKIKLEKIELAYEKQAIEIKNSKTINSLLFIIFCVSAFLLCFMFLAIKSRNKANLILKNTNIELQKTKEKAEENANLKSQFVSTISHELRTPLYGVVGITDLILQQQNSTTSKEHLESLKFSAKYLLGLVNNILQVGKIDDGSMVLQPEIFSLKQELKIIKNALRFLEDKNNNQFEIQIDDNIPAYLIGDEIKLSQIIMNLCSNALKFTNNGIVKIEVILMSLHETNANLKFKISDNGIGISKENHEIIFDKFVQIRRKSDDYQGTGLGLTIVKNLINLFGSKINIESFENKGTTFDFEICFETIKSSVNTAQQNIENPNRFCFHFLVVEDNKINQLVTQKTLEAENHTCIVVDNGADALTILDQQNFDFILMDINMPNLNGFDATKKIRSMNIKTPIIALTAFDKKEISLRAKNAGIDAIIEKPFESYFLFKTIYAFKKQFVNEV